MKTVRVNTAVDFTCIDLLRTDIASKHRRVVGSRTKPLSEGSGARAVSLKALIDLSAIYRSTLSRIQMLPDSSAMVNTSLSWVSESPTGGIELEILRRSLSNLDT